MNKSRYVFFILACLFGLYVQAQNRTVKGRVLSAEDKEPLIGATVKIPGTSIGVVTDIDGNFSLEVPDKDKTLVIEFLGMSTLTAKIPANGVLNVSLHPDTQRLDEVVVTGYGNFSKSSFTGSANTLRGDLLKNVPVVSVEQKLQGMTPGVSISGNSGQPGANQSIRIRGMGSFNASKEPLFVIDGVPVTSGSLSGGSADAAYMNNSKTNIMSTLNPSDIENITVIKDAAAASLYGSRAANGVILITTKKGTKGRAKATLKMDGGFSNAAVEFRPTLNGEQRRELIYEGLMNFQQDEIAKNPEAGLASPTEYADLHINDYASIPELGYTDWRKELMRTAHHQSYEASVSGGNDKTTFYSSLGFNRQEGLVENSNLDRYTARLNVTQKVGSRGEVGANVMFSQLNQEMNEERGSSINPFLCVALNTTPSFPVRDAEGNYVGSYPSSNVNPLRDIRTDYNRTRMTRMFSTGYASIDIIKGLKLKETLSYDYNIQKDSRYWNPLSGAGAKSGSDAQTAKGFIEYSKLISSTSLGYNTTIAQLHHVDALVAYEIENYQTDKAMGDKSKLPSDYLVEPDNAASLNSFVSSTQDSRMISYVSRINYDYDDRYYIAGSFRRDGSSRLSPENRWGNFWSVSGMWNVGAEKFMQSIKSVLSDLKIRASYGVNGNQPGALYGYMGLYSYGQNYMGGGGSYESALPNPNLKWEKNYNLNLGLDLAFINRIFASLEYYNRDTKDLLYQKPTPATSGYTSQVCNIGSMRNKGLEFTLGANLSKGSFSWHSDFNISFIRNKLTALLDNNEILTTSSMHALKVGEPIGSFYMIKWKGIYQSDDEIPAKIYDQGVRAGDCIYEDVDGNDVIDENDKQFVGSANPKFTGGFNNTFKYKGVDLSLFFTFSSGNKLYELWTGGLRMGNGTWPILKSSAESRWTGPGSTNENPRAIYGYTWNSTKFVNTRMLHDASYIRCRTASIGYTLPKSWINRIHIDNLRIYFQADNLFILTKWPYLDPEVNVSLSATNMGYDYLYPSQPRTFTIGVNLKF